MKAHIQYVHLESQWMDGWMELMLFKMNRNESQEAAGFYFYIHTVCCFSN